MSSDHAPEVLQETVKVPVVVDASSPAMPSDSPSAELSADQAATLKRRRDSADAETLVQGEGTRARSPTVSVKVLDDSTGAPAAEESGIGSGKEESASPAKKVKLVSDETSSGYTVSSPHASVEAGEEGAEAVQIGDAETEPASTNSADGTADQAAGLTVLAQETNEIQENPPATVTQTDVAVKEVVIKEVTGNVESEATESTAGKGTQTKADETKDLIATKSEAEPTSTKSKGFVPGPSPFAALASSGRPAFAGAAGSSGPSPSPFATLATTCPPAFASTSAGFSAFSSTSGNGASRPTFGAGFTGQTFASFASVSNNQPAGGASIFATPAATTTTTAQLGAMRGKGNGSGTDDQNQDDDNNNDGNDDEGDGANDSGAEEGNGHIAFVGPPEPSLPVVETVTGEEGETTVFTTNCKLYEMDKQLIWRERGVGILKVNRSIADPPVSRLIMRSESVHRVILNAKIFKQMSAEIAQDKFVRIGVVGENNAIVRYAIRCKNRDLAQQLYDAIDEARLMTAVE